MVAFLQLCLSNKKGLFDLIYCIFYNYDFIKGFKPGRKRRYLKKASTLKRGKECRAYKHTTECRDFFLENLDMKKVVLASSSMCVEKEIY